MLGLPPLGGLVYSPLPQPRQGHHEGQVCSGHGAAAAQLDVPAFQEATPATKPPCRVSCLDTGAMNPRTDFTAGLPSALGPGWAGCRLIQTPALVLVRGTPASFRWRRETQGSPWTRHWTARWGLFLSASPHCPTSNHLLAFFKRGQGVSEHRPAGLEAKEAPWQLWVPLPRDSPTAAPAHVRTQVV